MATFQYKTDGRTVGGTVEAKSLSAAEQQLRSAGTIYTNVKKLTAPTTPTAYDAAKVSSSKPTSSTLPVASPYSPTASRLTTHANAAIDQANTSIMGEQAAADAAAATAAANTTAAKRDAGLASLLKVNDQLARQPQAGVDALASVEESPDAKALRAINRKIASKARAYDLQLRDVQQNNSTGMYGGGQSIATNAIEMQRASEMADYAITQMALQGEYDSAMKIALAQVDANTESLKLQRDGLVQYLQLNADDLSEKEKVTLLAEIQRQDSALDFERQKQLMDKQAQIDEASAIAGFNRSGGAGGGAGGFYKVTEGQSNAAIYATRLGEANTVLDSLGNLGAQPEGYLASKLPGIWKSSDRQKLEQAQRNFINASLRRESGANIAPAEFESAALQYFPQPGDSAAVIEQKRKNRATQQAGLMAAAGPNALSNLEGFRTPEAPQVSDEEARSLGASLGIEPPEAEATDTWTSFKNFLGF